jgi:hypothetical protein
LIRLFLESSIQTYSEERENEQSPVEDSGQESDSQQSNLDALDRHKSHEGGTFKRLRSKSSRRRLRWQSFYNAHQPSFRSRPIQLNSLSAGQVRNINYSRIKLLIFELNIIVGVKLILAYILVKKLFFYLKTITLYAFISQKSKIRCSHWSKTG